MIRIAFLASLALACLAAPVRAEILPHPFGCPRRAFCGCGASVEIFGRPVRDLFLARNWFRFPRAAPGHNMAAVRRGHVFILKSHVQGDVWQVVDHNSGGRRSRVHHRSIRGLAIVNPMGGRNSYASAAHD